MAAAAEGYDVPCLLVPAECWCGYAAWLSGIVNGVTGGCTHDG